MDQMCCRIRGSEDGIENCSKVESVNRGSKRRCDDRARLR